MTKITDAILIDAIEPLDAIFDTHAVIRKVMQISPREYAIDLFSVSGADHLKTRQTQEACKSTGLNELWSGLRGSSPRTLSLGS